MFMSILTVSRSNSIGADLFLRQRTHARSTRQIDPGDGDATTPDRTDFVVSEDLKTLYSLVKFPKRQKESVSRAGEGERVTNESPKNKEGWKSNRTINQSRLEFCHSDRS